MEIHLQRKKFNLITKNTKRFDKYEEREGEKGDFLFEKHYDVVLSNRIFYPLFDEILNGNKKNPFIL